MSHQQSKISQSMRQSVTQTCVDPESFVRGGPHLICFVVFVDDEGIEDRDTTINGSSSARH